MPLFHRPQKPSSTEAAPASSEGLSHEAVERGLGLLEQIAEQTYVVAQTAAINRPADLQRAEALAQRQKEMDDARAEVEKALENESPAKKALKAKLEDPSNKEKPSTVVFNAIKEYSVALAGEMPSPVSGKGKGYLYRYILQEPYKAESPVTPGFFQLGWQDRGIPVGYKAPKGIKKKWHALRHIEEPRPESRFVWVAEKKGEYKPGSTDPAAQKYDMVRGWGIDQAGNLCVIDFDRVRRVDMPIKLEPYDRGGDIRVGDPLEMLRLYAKPMLEPGNDVEAFLSMYDYFTGQLDTMRAAVNPPKADA